MPRCKYLTVVIKKSVQKGRFQRNRNDFIIFVALKSTTENILRLLSSVALRNYHTRTFFEDETYYIV